LEKEWIQINCSSSEKGGKEMKRVLSLRGTFLLADNARTTDNQIFVYEGAELTRGWKVTSAYVWPADMRAQTGADGQFLLCTNLATDTVGSLGFNDITSVNDNRFIGWGAKGYNQRDASSDFITGPTGIITDNQLLLDPEHVVVQELYINAYTSSDSDTSPTRSYNYLVVLEEMKLTAAETILQIIKSKGQDILN